MIERNIDYLQFTANFHEYEFHSQEYKKISGIGYYPRGYEDEHGTRFYFGENRGMSTFVVLSGEPLDAMRQRGSHDSDILAWAIGNGARFSRIDLAVTEFIEDTLFTTEDVEAWFWSKKITSALCEGGCKKIVDVIPETDEQLQTLYIGDRKKRGKKGIFRAYDKSIDMGIGNEIATRIELEIKREKAHTVAMRLSRNFDISGNFRVYFNVSDKEFDRIMDADAVNVTRGENKKKTKREDEMANRWNWLMKQVAPALKEAFEHDKKNNLGDGNLAAFLNIAGVYSDARKFVDFHIEQRILEIGETHNVIPKMKTKERARK